MLTTIVLAQVDRRLVRLEDVVHVLLDLKTYDTVCRMASSTSSSRREQL
jgi:hypothetical protein